MTSFEYEISYIHAGLDELETYLLSKELFWPILATPPTGGQPFPRLTLGALLLSLHKARALVGTAEERVHFEEAQRNVETLHNKWRSAWEKKAQRELQSRLNQWRNYLAEYRQNPQRQAAYFKSEIRLRVIIQLLEPEAGELDPALTEMRSGLDQILRGLFKPGDFIWEEALQASFPPSQFWYLYGRLRENSK